MSTKYANVIVKGNQSTEVCDALAELLKATGRGKEGIFFNHDPIYVGSVTPGWTTVMHSTFEWLTVHEVAERLSKYLRSEVISIAYHYDQIFEMTIYRNGLKMTTHRSGDYLDVYEVPYLLGDVEEMIRVFDADLESQQIVDILKIKDIRQKVWDLETSFNISLENKSDWFEMLESEVKENFVLI